MENTIDKELLDHLKLLEGKQQEQVLAYVKELLVSDEMNRRAAASEKDIADGNVITLEEFKGRLEQWKAQRRSGIK